MTGFSPENKERKIFEHVSLESEGIMKDLNEAPIYRKFVTIKARPGIVGEKIETKMQNGLKETSQIVEENEMIVTNPDGEEYIIPKEEFDKNYEETKDEGIYQSKGLCKAIENPFKEPIEIDAPWGEVEKEYADCMVVIKCDETGKVFKKPYLIARKEFDDTYKLAA